ncbi:hypothetical protein [Microbacterium sp. NIBRBAC000506063]|uniref:hypothetical protein n=1 Tax=Microbacterium sp. NIBRBAC000506063 TaxID=2734618 RepID=UPI001BB49C99|nr:hypothetical protein [Microbacterium sp. NIBRBAC000506063]QTV80347.1 hypothetical protein KAE78_05190 [Microbacterium sp. NIBRBAC000506063]
MGGAVVELGRDRDPVAFLRQRVDDERLECGGERGAGLEAEVLQLPVRGVGSLVGVAEATFCGSPGSCAESAAQPVSRSARAARRARGGVVFMVILSELMSGICAGPSRY